MNEISNFKLPVFYRSHVYKWRQEGAAEVSERKNSETMSTKIASKMKKSENALNGIRKFNRFYGQNLYS